jgi:hypothetical protein
LEAKQFEYAVRGEDSGAQFITPRATAWGDAHDREAMMTHPRMAAFMEADTWRQFLWSLVLT